MQFTSFRRIVVACAVAGGGLRAGELRAQEPAAPRVWDAGLLDKVAEIPVQDAGRIKPLLTFADCKLLQLSGRRELAWTVRDGDHVTPFERSSVEWLLDCILFPKDAATCPCFLIEHAELLDDIGVAPAESPARERWSYDQLSAGRATLSRKAEQLMRDPAKSEAKNRSVVEEELIELNEKMGEFEGLLEFLDFARQGFPGEAALQASRFATALCLIPPPEKPGGNLNSEATWLTIPDVLERTSDETAKQGGFEPQLAAVAAIVQAWSGRGDSKALNTALTKLHDVVVALATARGEYAKVRSEVAFERSGLFSCAIALYVVGGLVVAIGWRLRRDHPRQRQYWRWMWRFMAIPVALNVAGIAWRCWLSGRPPGVTTYEMILCIPSFAAVAALVIERLNRRRVALGLAALIGASGLWFASRYEVKEAFTIGTDTLPRLPAVLNANSWLTLHVGTVTIGYAAGLLAGLLGHVYLIQRLFESRTAGANRLRPIARMTYGLVCLALVFSFVGSLCGGLWANESWGRFWGWDPEENGGLMVSAFLFAIWYARMDGRLNDLALNTAAVFCTTLIAFSWWHVSVLGVGLHAYGFMHGVREKLWAFYGVEWLVVATGLLLWFVERRRGTATSRSTTAAGLAAT